MLNAVFNMAHNYMLLKNCEDTINAFHNADNVKIWIEDEKENRFVPSGNIKIGYLETVKLVTRRGKNE